MIRIDEHDIINPLNYRLNYTFDPYNLGWFYFGYQI